MGGVWYAALGDGRSESGLQLHLVSSVNRAERLARLLRVLAAIIAEPGLNPLELAEKAGVSERTLRRDLSQLRELGYEVAYTSGYEVQEKLNLEGRGKKTTRPRGDDALLQAVAHAVEAAGLWRDTTPASVATPRKRARRATGPRPLVLIPSGHGDADFIYATGMDVEVDQSLFEAERRHKTREEADKIRDAQRAAEKAMTEIVRLLAQAEIREELLWADGKPMTSEWLYARASLLLAELGFSCPDMIIAGSPDNAMPHYRGEGQIRAGAPVIIDIFPASRGSHYNGDLTRTVVVGDIPEEVRRMHAATLQALDVALESIKAGVPANEVHHAVCQVLVDRGYGSTTTGYEGADGVAKMNHSTGHGVGLEVHEEPGVRSANGEPLEEGDVITVEPGLYLMGFGGVRVEDTGMVTARGFENFTSITRSIDPNDYL